jgi:hypothetical protein
MLSMERYTLHDMIVHHQTKERCECYDTIRPGPISELQRLLQRHRHYKWQPHHTLLVEVGGAKWSRYENRSCREGGREK